MSKYIKSDGFLGLMVSKKPFNTIKKEFHASNFLYFYSLAVVPVFDKIAEMATSISLRTRGIMFPLVYGVFPYLYKGLRTFKKSADAKIGEKLESKGISYAKRQSIYESAYGVALTIPIKTGSYVASYLSKGDKIELDEIGVAVGISTVVSGVIAPWVLYGVDVFKDLMGGEPLELSRARAKDQNKDFKNEYIRNKTRQFENWLSGKSESVKKKVGYAFLTGCIGLSAIVYSAFPAYEKENDLKTHSVETTEHIDDIISSHYNFSKDF